MPTSFELGKQYTKNIVNRIKPQRGLDIGPGCGTYAKLFPDTKWTGIEIWQPYVDQYKLKEIYEKIIVADVRDYNISSLGKFDVVIAGDVIEHMSVVEAIKVLNQLKAVSDTVIISIPIGHHPQGEHEGNPYETHVVDDWTDEAVKDVFGPPTWSVVDGCIGVYCWSNKKIMPKICVYTITKNEEHFVKRWADSAKEADILVMADTGSSDNTVQVARENGVVVHEICITPWRFDHARNANIALIPKDVDVCICMDADEVLEPGWRQEIERVWTPDTTRLSYFFDWGAGIKFRYEKIHARHGYFWHHPCHEYPVFDKRIKEVWAYTDKLLVSHYPDPTKSRGQYMDLLQLSVDEDPSCPRNAFYYARELSFNYRWQEAIDACNRYLALPGAVWQNERCYALRVMGQCYEELGNREEAERAFQRACSEAPNTREPWCQLAMLMYRQGRWEECFAYSSRALRIVSRELVYTCDPAVWGHWPHDLMSLAAWNLGLKDIALQQAKLAVEKTPGEQRLVNNLAFIQNAIDSEKGFTVPNIVHFMYFFGPKSREFSYVNYLAVKAAHEVQKPDKIYFYYNKEPDNNPHWDAMKQYVEMVYIEPPTEWHGVSLNEWSQYQADIVRLQKLYEHGGVYLDTDAILTKPLTPFFKNKCTMSGKINGISEGATEGGEHTSAATIIAEPKSEFIRLWIDGLTDALKKQVWAWHSVCLPVELYKEHKDLMTLLPEKDFLPFDFNDQSIFNPSKTDEIMPTLESAYVVHLWETIWHDVLRNIDRNYLSLVDNAFTRLFRKYG